MKTHPQQRREPHSVCCAAVLLVGRRCTARATTRSNWTGLFPRSTLQIATPDARLHEFDIWVADNDARRSAV